MDYPNDDRETKRKLLIVLSKMVQRIKAIRRSFLRRMEMSSARRALLQSSVLTDTESSLLRRVSLRIAPDDLMYVVGQSGHYLAVGLSAMRSIDTALQHVHLNPRNVLDLPSGHGRVLRFLKVAYSKADITACELDRSAVQFCERTFGVTGIMSNSDVSALTFPHQFDLIWCGSLVTHLDAQRISNLLRSFWRCLTPGGLCLFSTHGRTALNKLQSGETYLLSANARQKVLSEFTACGFGYADYDKPGYGISLVSFDRMTKMSSAVGNWSLAVFLESGWDHHQDVYGFIKPIPGSWMAPSALIVKS